MKNRQFYGVLPDKQSESNIVSKKNVESIGVKKFVLELDDSDKFYDGSILSYTSHELSDEALQAITNHFSQ